MRDGRDTSSSPRVRPRARRRESDTNPPRSGAGRGALGLAVVVLALAAPVLWAIALAGIDLVRLGAWGALVPHGRAVWSSVWAAGLIGLLAVVLALPGAVVLSRAKSMGWAALAAVPAMLPPYLAYSGWGVLRDPTWWSGRLIADAGLMGAAPKGLAIIGLAMWAWPLAAAIMAASLRERAGLLEALRLEPITPWRRMVFAVSAHRGALLAAWALVAVVMLGSAVPLHLAQFQTLSTRVWLTLDQSAADERFRAWAGAWPLLVAAGVAGAVFGAPRRMGGGSGGFGETGRGRRVGGQGRWAMLGFALAWTAAVLVPVGFFAMTLRRPEAIRSFLDRAGDSIGTSVGVALVVGAGVALLAVWCAGAAGAWRGRDRAIARRVARLSLMLALVPGVLVGQAVGASLRSGVFDWLTGSAAVLVLVHLIRFGFVGLVGGWLLARAESVELAWARAMDGADSAWGWCRAMLGLHGPWVVVLALVAGALSVHEIEAVVMVAPPGVDTLSRRVLDDLHFERPDQRSAAALVLVGIGLVQAGLVAAVSWWARRSPRGRQ